MLIEGADGIRGAEESLGRSALTAHEEASEMAQIAAQTSDNGTRTLADGRNVRVFSNLNLNYPVADAGNGITYGFNGAEGFVSENDPIENPLLVGYRINGTITEPNGDSRPFFIETINSDFREVDGCDLYEPYRRVSRMGGMLNDEQMAEMEEARAQLEEFEAQLAAMPPAQRAMMEGMIGSQMDMVRNMANGGVMEHVQEIEEIICNPDLKALFSPVDPAYELQQIQRDLVALGYTPGNTDGVLDVLTEVAISQYQAERGLPVTGQPNPGLALQLANEVAGQG